MENILLIFDNKCYLIINPTQEYIDVLEDSCGNRCEEDEYEDAWNLAVDKLILAILIKKTPMNVIRDLNIYNKQLIKKWLGAFNEFFVKPPIYETINKTYYMHIDLEVLYLGDKQLNKYYQRYW